MDIKTYTCVPSCGADTKAISSTHTHDKRGIAVKYCRPYVNNKLYTYEYYVDPTSTAVFELGTFEYPFKNIATPSVEILNFMYEKTTNYTTYVKRGTSLKMYYGLMPIVIVNIDTYNLTTYDSSPNNPRVYITGHEYLWPESTLFSIAEN